MSSGVFVNLRAIVGKATGGMSMAFPDVCFTPPQTPFVPPGIPIPYPNIGMAADTSGGSSSVTVLGQPLMLGSKSSFSKSSGDEAGSASKKGIITSKIQGAVYFVSWSMDVMIEGEPAVRALDLSTHNHAAPQLPNTPPAPHIGS